MAMPARAGAMILYSLFGFALVLAAAAIAWVVISKPPRGAGPYWAFGWEMRSIPSEAMLPTLMVGDRVSVDTFAYREGRIPKRGDVVIFAHPNSDRVMVKRVVGLPGDSVQMVDGLLLLNGKPAGRTLVRKVVYPSDYGRLQAANEYSEQFPGETLPHSIFEFSDDDRLDRTPAFLVPPGSLFMMGDSRDNSEDSRAPTGHRELVKQNPDAWNMPPYLGGDPRDDAIGFVPMENLIGRARAVPFSMYGCSIEDRQKAGGAECLESRIGRQL